MTTKSRREMLESFVASRPNDAFARYGLAMECAGSGDLDAAEGHFAALVAANPDYVATYYHYGQLLVRLERIPDAKRIFSTGMEVARKAGNMHAFSELEQALRDLA